MSTSPSYARWVHHGVTVLTADDPFDDKVIATSRAMTATIESAQLVAEKDDPVFVFGESGAGVGWLCRWIHCSTTKRRNSPLVVVAAQTMHPSEHGAILFGSRHDQRAAAVEAAGAGTLVVRCFEELAPELRGRLLASGGAYRLIATCYANGGNTPKRCLSAETLAAFSAVIEVPPLRARSDDLGELAVHLSQSWGPGLLIEDDLDHFARTTGLEMFGSSHSCSP
jgi:transcriptional regulator with GAF, ATPase, and Fis domain